MALPVFKYPLSNRQTNRAVSGEGVAVALNRLRRYAFPFLARSVPPAPWLTSVVLIFLGTRLALAVTSFASLVLVPLNPAGNPRLLPANLLLDGWLRWDSLSYLALAQEGYWYDHATGLSSPSLGPVYPLTVAALGMVLDSLPVAGLLVSNLALLIALLSLYRLIADDLGEKPAATACLLICVFPFAFVYSAAYPHSLALAFALAAFLSARRGRTWLSQVLVAAAVLTVPAILALWPATALVCSRAHPGRSRRHIALMLSVLPALLFAFALYLVSQLRLPPEFVARILLGLRDASLPYYLQGLPLVPPVIDSTADALLVGLWALAAAATLSLPAIYRTLGLPYALYTAGVIVLTLLTVPTNFAEVLPLAFPLFALTAHYLRNELARASGLATSALLLGIMTSAFACWYTVSASAEPPLHASDPLRLVARYQAQGEMPANQLALNVDSNLLLLGYDLSQARYRPGEVVYLPLFVHRIRPTETRYLLSAHLQDLQGQRWSAGHLALFDLDGPAPLRQVLRLDDSLALPIDNSLPAGVYSLQLAVHIVPPFSSVYEQPLILDPTGTSVDQITLGELVVARPEEAMAAAETNPQHRINASLGDQIKLLGYDLAPAAVAPGDSVAVSLYWSAETVPQRNYTVFLQLLDSRGQLLTQADGWPFSGRFPTTALTPGLVVRDTRVLTVPANASSGPWRLIGGLYLLETMERLPVRTAAVEGVHDYVDLGELLVAQSP